MLGMKVMEYDGIFIVDFFFMLDRGWLWQQHVGAMLLELYWSIVWRCFAVVIPGAAFLWVSYLRVMEALFNIVASPRFLVWISMGNDVYAALSHRRNVHIIVIGILKVMRVALRHCSQ